MHPTKYQIFVSSTYTDLVQVRRGVIEVIQGMLHFPVGMEYFSADDDEQWQIIQEIIQQTDYYICIIGHRYGSLTRDGRSFTEKEWDYAKQTGVPIYSFIRNRDAKTAPSERESDAELIKKLDAFVAKASTDKMVDFWNDEMDLSLKVAKALHKAFSRKPRPGWIRAQSESVAGELAMLSLENRSLRNQVEKLASQAIHALPQIDLLINDATQISLTYVGDELLTLSTTPKVEEIDWKSVPKDLKEFLSEDEVQEYNRALPEQRVIDEKVRAIHYYERLCKTKQPLTISIKNSGNAKARELYIDIVFPPAVAVLEEGEIDDISPPEITLPKNPLEKAKQQLRQNRSKPSLSTFLSNLPRFASPAIDLQVIEPKSESLRMPNIFSRDRWLRIKDNKITIYLLDLMHTREHVFSGLFLVPNAPVSSEINATVICGEMTDATKLKFPLTITQST